MPSPPLCTRSLEPWEPPMEEASNGEDTKWSI
jgi:hypothetical protein